MKTFFELNIIDWMLHITHLLHIGYEAFFKVLVEGPLNKSALTCH